MNYEALKPIIESVLFAANEPLNAERIRHCFPEDEKPSLAEIRAAVADLQQDYQTKNIQLIEIASGYCFQVTNSYAPYVTRLWEEKPPRFSRALLETLALVAYRQPITRAEIEEIRGVAVSPNIMKSLLEREWVQVVGHKEVPGRPALFATTKQFLDHFNLKNLSELPELTNVDQLETSENNNS